MRNLIAPWSSYALPSSTRRRAISAQSCSRSSWKVTSPSQSSPSQRSESWICWVASSTSRFVSVFSIRSRNSPPSWRANSQLKSAVRTFPMWRKPVGLGAMRTRTGTPLGYWRAVWGPLFRGCEEGPRQCDRDGRRGRAALRTEPANLAVSRARPRRPRGIQVEARSGGPPRPRSRALPRQPRRPRRSDLLEERRHDALDRRCGLRDRGRRGDLPHRLSSRRRLRDGSRASSACAGTGARPLQRANVVADGELRRRRGDDGTLDRRARGDLRSTRTTRTPWCL